MYSGTLRHWSVYRCRLFSWIMKALLNCRIKQCARQSIEIAIFPSPRLSSSIERTIVDQIQTSNIDNQMRNEYVNEESNNIISSTITLSFSVHIHNIKCPLTPKFRSLGESEQRTV